MKGKYVGPGFNGIGRYQLDLNRDEFNVLSLMLGQSTFYGGLYEGRLLAMMDRLYRAGNEQDRPFAPRKRRWSKQLPKEIRDLNKGRGDMPWWDVMEELYGEK